jgi:hypothetical protein
MTTAEAPKWVYPGIRREELVPARDVKGDAPFFATITEIRPTPRQPKNPVVVIGGCMNFGGGTLVKPLKRSL